MEFSIEILDSDNKISNNILKAIAEEFNGRFSSKLSSIKNEISIKVVEFLQNTNTYSSLVDGDLADHFGLPIGDRRARIDSILQMIGNNIEIDFKPIKVFGIRFVNEVKIGVLIKDFVDILSMSESIVQTKKGQELPWLHWLLIRGNAVIISEHQIKFLGGRGRSGGAIMVKNNAKVWRVPIEYSGTIGSNWLIRAFTENSDGFTSIITNILQKALS